MRRDLILFGSVLAFTWFLSAGGSPLPAFSGRTSGRALQSQAGKSSAGHLAQARAGLPAPVPEGLSNAPLEMKRIAWLVGTWRVEESYQPGGVLAPSGGMGNGTAVIKVGPGGLSLLADYKGQGLRGAVAAHGVIAYVRETDGYQISWSDDSSPSASRLSGAGDWNEEVIELRGSLQMNATKLAMKAISYDLAPNSFSANLYLGKGSELHPELRMDCTKLQTSQPTPR
jgi:hypothetical protein